MNTSRRIYYTWLFHICLWTVLFLCIIVWRPGHTLPQRPLTNLQLIASMLPYVALFYLHSLWIMPSFLFRRKKMASYALLTLAVFIGAVLLSGLGLHFGPIRLADANNSPLLFRRMAQGVFFLLASASLGVFRENSRLEELRKEKETEHLRTELSFLRGQVNPHFMLNVLNSMVLLARRKSELMEPVLMELAELMSYMLYDASSEKISLEDEIGYLRAYIDLQMLRFGDDVKVQFNTPDSVNGCLIEPMLLIPLVENAFKHGIGLVEDPVIYIDIRAGQEQGLSMTVENKYNPLIGQQEIRPMGIGLTNLRKRLELIYPNEYKFVTTYRHDGSESAACSWFITVLNIPLL